MKNAVIRYTDTTSPEAVDRYVKKWSREAGRAYSWKRRQKELRKQKLSGMILLAITVPVVRLFDGDVTIAVVTVPAGIGLIMSAKGE